MRSSTSVPAAFELSVVDGREWLSFKAATESALESSARGTWAVIQSLDLARPADATMEGSTSLAPGADRQVARLMNRRLAFKQATLMTSVARLQEALSWCPLAEAGLSDVRVWKGPGGVRLAGRFAAGGAEAAFTIRVAVEPRNDGRRRVLLSFLDVRLFGALPVPAPLIGAAVARALAAGVPPGSAVRFGVREAALASLELDPLEAMLTGALVSKGWRLPDLTRAWLQSLAQSDGTIQLRFASDGHPTERLATLEPRGEAPAVVWLEGERLPESLAEGDRLLFAGDLGGAEAEYRKAISESPENRSAQARLLAVRAAADGDAASNREVVALADALLSRWPDFVPGILHAAIAAAKEGDRARAATLFARVATLAEERGETEDALLARAAAAAADSSSVEDAAVPRVAVADASEDVTKKTAAVYAEEGDADRRAEALGEMLIGFERLAPERQHAAYASFGRVAEATGDLEYAEEAYWRAASAAAEPGGRAGDLIAHARVLLARGNPAAAIAEMEEALVLAPEHMGELVLLAEQAMETGEWERARDLYALLDRTPGADQAIPRQTLLLRRGRLARTAGDSRVAEACYRNLAALDPRQVEARQVLAEIALERHDLGAAAERLEEVLQLLPPDALEPLLDARQHLGEIYVGMGDWRAARPYVELVLAQNPRHIPTLERAAEIYENLGLHAAAAEAFARLARFHAVPRARARALMRAGHIWQATLGDEARGFDAYLKASDLDPTDGPTAVRVIEGYWRRGQFAEAVEMAGEARRSGCLPEIDLPSCLRLAVAAALALPSEDEESALLRHPWNLETAAMVFSETAAHLAGGPPDKIAPAIAVLEKWYGAQDGHREKPEASSAGPAHEEPLEDLWALMSERLLADPTAAPAGLAAALAWIATRQS